MKKTSILSLSFIILLGTLTPSHLLAKAHHPKEKSKLNKSIGISIHTHIGSHHPRKGHLYKKRRWKRKIWHPFFYPKRHHAWQHHHRRYHGPCPIYHRRHHHRPYSHYIY